MRRKRAGGGKGGGGIFEQFVERCTRDRHRQRIHHFRVGAEQQGIGPPRYTAERSVQYSVLRRRDAKCSDVPVSFKYNAGGRVRVGGAGPPGPARRATGAPRTRPGRQLCERAATRRFLIRCLRSEAGRCWPGYAAVCARRPDHLFQYILCFLAGGWPLNAPAAQRCTGITERRTGRTSGRTTSSSRPPSVRPHRLRGLQSECLS